MAGRPPKQSLDFAGWDVSILDGTDPVIDKLIGSQGCVGFTIYFYLCQKAYGSNGYYYSWCYDDAFTTARRLGGGASAGTVSETVRTCLQIGLFSKRLFDEWGILTSRGIQKRYMQVALTRTNKSVIQEYWLLKKDESAGLVFCTLKSNYDPPKLNYDPPELNYPTPNYSTVKNSICSSCSSASAENGDMTNDDELTRECIRTLFINHLSIEPNKTVVDMCAEWLKEIDLEVLEYAIKETDSPGTKDPIKYLKGIMRNLRTSNIRTAADLAESNDKNQQRKAHHERTAAQKEMRPLGRNSFNSYEQHSEYDIEGFEERMYNELRNCNNKPKTAERSEP